MCVVCSAMDDDGSWATIVLGEGPEVLLFGTVSVPSGCALAAFDLLLKLSLACKRDGLQLRLVAVHRDLRELAELVGVPDQLGIP